MLKINNFIFIFLACTPLITFGENSFSSESLNKAPSFSEKPNLSEEATLYPLPDYSGSLLKRSFLTGDWWGYRSTMGNHGVQIEGNFTYIFQGPISGGYDSSIERNSFSKFEFNPEAFRNRLSALLYQSFLNANSISPTFIEQLRAVGKDLRKRSAKARKKVNGLIQDLERRTSYQSDWEGGGSLDLKLKLDFQKMGLWAGGFLEMEGEYGFGNDVNGHRGALLPVNTDALFPSPEDETLALHSLFFTQFVHERAALILGKLDTTTGDMNEFAHGKGNMGFMNLGFNLNPITMRTIPYSPLGAGLLLLLGEKKDIIWTFFAMDTEGKPNTDGFDTVFDEGTSYSTEVRIPVRVFNKPGHQLFGFIYADKDFVSLQQDARSFQLEPLELSIASILDGFQTESDSWAFYYNFDQYLFVEDEVTQQGWGLFGRFGISDGEANPIERFWSLGVGGRGLIPGRDKDRFGTGWFLTEWSDSLPKTLGLNNEHGFEVFYEVAITPWMYLTPDIQVILPSRDRADTLLISGLRVNVVF